MKRLQRLHKHYDFFNKLVGVGVGVVVSSRNRDTHVLQLCLVKVLLHWSEWNQAVQDTINRKKIQCEPILTWGQVQHCFLFFLSILLLCFFLTMFSPFLNTICSYKLGLKLRRLSGKGYGEGIKFLMKLQFFHSTA